MKLLLRLLLLAMMGSAYAQSNLPVCQGSDDSRWTNCYGSLTFLYGQNYIGEFRGGQANGKGTYTFPDGAKYVGEFMDNKRNGQGAFYASNGSIIQQGIWADGMLIRSEPVQGASIRDNSNQSSLPTCNARGSNQIGTLYLSNWTNCFGTGISAIGEKYVGEWRDGKFNGRGTFFYADGSFEKGIWSDGRLIRSESDQEVIAPRPEVAKLRAEAEEAKRKQAELEQQLRLSQNQPPVLSTPTPATTPSMGKRLALVIGNQAYNVRPLLNPRNDADDMSRALKNAGFEVIDVRDASLAQMRNAVRQFGDRLLTRDVGLVYYSGHGIEVRGRNYFIPVNADIKRSDEIADQSLDVNLILEKMETAKKGVNILIVDACRDDPFGRSFRSASRGLANMDAPQGTIIAFATSPGKVAADGDGRNSPYTKNLIKTMQIPNLPIEQVFKQVRRAVQQETKNQQTPWENTSLSGDFYFSVKK